MPLPTPHMGKKPESKQTFVSRCAGDPISLKEFPDQKQRLGYCYSAWERKKETAAYVITTAHDEFIYEIDGVKIVEDTV